MKLSLTEGNNPLLENETDIEKKEVTTEQLNRSVNPESPEEEAYRIIIEHSESQEIILHKEDYIRNPEGYLEALKRKETLEQQYSDWILEFNEKYPEELDRAILRSIENIPMTEEREESDERTKANIFRLLPCFSQYDPAFAKEHTKDVDGKREGLEVDFK